MQLTLSTLFALATVLSVAALEQLKDHLTVTVVTDWTTGYISYGEESHDVAQLNDPIHVVVDGEDKVYQRVMRLNFENVDPEDTREISITRNEDGQPATPHFQVSVVKDPGVKLVHVIFDGMAAGRVNVFGDAVLMQTVRVGA